MGNFFHVQGGGGQYPALPSPPTNSAVLKFLQSKAGLPEREWKAVLDRTVASAMHSLTSLQGCQMWNHPQDLEEVALSKEQRALIGFGYAGPAVALDGIGLTENQLRRCAVGGLDERQLRMLKAEIRYHLPSFHEIIDRAISIRVRRGSTIPGEFGGLGGASGCGGSGVIQVGSGYSRTLHPGQGSSKDLLPRQEQSTAEFGTEPAVGILASLEYDQEDNRGIFSGAGTATVADSGAVLSATPPRQKFPESYGGSELLMHRHFA